MRVGISAGHGPRWAIQRHHIRHRRRAHRERQRRHRCLRPCGWCTGVSRAPLRRTHLEGIGCLPIHIESDDRKIRVGNRDVPPSDIAAGVRGYIVKSSGGAVLRQNVGAKAEAEGSRRNRRQAQIGSQWLRQGERPDDVAVGRASRRSAKKVNGLPVMLYVVEATTGTSTPVPLRVTLCCDPVMLF